MERVLTDEEVSALLELFHASPAPGGAETGGKGGSLVEHELQRRFFRSSQCLPAVLRVDGKDYQAEATNISLGGVFIRCPLAAPVGRQVDLELEFPCPRHKVTLSGCVCWQKRGRRQMTGLGVRFSLLPAEAIWIIIANIEKVSRQDC